MSIGREIRTKISSVKNTQKITRAMELVAASKMRRAQERMNMSRPYAAKIRRVISHVASAHAEYQHPYMQQRETVKRVGFLVITTDRGLCGGLNINLFRKTILEMQKYSLDPQGIKIDVCTIGRKGEVFFSQHGANMLGSVKHLGDAPSVQDIIGVVKIMLKEYDEGKLDRIYICANEFINTMVQKPIVRQLLPLQAETVGYQKDKSGKFVTTDDGRLISDNANATTQKHWDYLYEPDSAKTLLTMLLVRYVESQVYQAMVENIACEQAARMMAMKNATDNAKEIIKELQLAFNKARQAAITREIAEIVAGAAALE